MDEFDFGDTFRFGAPSFPDTWHRAAGGEPPRWSTFAHRWWGLFKVRRAVRKGIKAIDAELRRIRETWERSEQRSGKAEQ